MARCRKRYGSNVSRPWGYADSQRGWERTILGITEGRSADEVILVAEAQKGEIIGIVLGNPVESDGDVGEVRLLYVYESRQGRGVGRRLVQAVAAALAQMGKQSLQVHVLETNMPARGFYEAIGGTLTGKVEGDDGVEVIYRWPEIGAIS